jgi:hypothetical protein
LRRVRVPVLLIAGGYALEVVELNRRTFHRLTMEKRLEIIPRTTYLFEEAGALEVGALLARGWFQKYLQGRG